MAQIVSDLPPMMLRDMELMSFQVVIEREDVEYVHFHRTTGLGTNTLQSKLVCVRQRLDVTNSDIGWFRLYQRRDRLYKWALEREKSIPLERDAYARQRRCVNLLDGRDYALNRCGGSRQELSGV